MAYSFVQYTANGSTNQFSITFPYISRDHIKVYVDGVEDTGKTFVSDTIVQTSTTPANGIVVEVARVTPKSTPVVDFSDASTLTASNLDNMGLQFLYLSQEAQDATDRSLQYDSTGVFDATNRRIKNVADPTDAQDVATKNYVDTAPASPVAQATAQANIATTQAGIATTQADNAATSAGSAATSESNAAGSASSAAASAAAIAAGISATSTTTLTLGLGAQDLAVQTGKNFSPGQTLNVANTTDPTKVMSGPCTAYDAATGDLKVNVSLVNGTGSFSSWIVSVGGNATPGLSGDLGASGALYLFTNYQLWG